MNTCVYAICKNEEKNIIKWLDSVYKDSDLIVLVDTGSTDNTINLVNHYDDYDNKIYFYDYYEMKDQKEFSFSNARNYCLDKAKNIIPTLEFGILNWVFISLDIDEFIHENGINKIKNIWNLNYDTIQLVSISDGIKIPVNHKVHGYNFHWERDVHEIIVRDDGLREKIGIYYYLILNMIMFKINQNREIILNCFLIVIIKEILVVKLYLI